MTTMVEACPEVRSKSSGALTQTETPLSTRTARRRRKETRRYKILRVGDDIPEGSTVTRTKKQRLEVTKIPRKCDCAVENCDDESRNGTDAINSYNGGCQVDANNSGYSMPKLKYGVASFLGRRRDMEDALTISPSLCHGGDGNDSSLELHYFGVYDGHGCSHVAMRCRERMHQLVKEELEMANLHSPQSRNEESEWKEVMERSFFRMDKEAMAWSQAGSEIAPCRCELQAPKCYTVGSTAVVTILARNKIIVANCGDSRAVLCRSGAAIPLSSDHKPDRPDELRRIQEAGGRVIYWDGPRVLGVLAMSRAIGDNYLKPYVSCMPEVTVTERKEDDEFLIIATDGLWDVVPNDTACQATRMCLRGKPASQGAEPPNDACSVASVFLTKLALARHSTDNVSVVVVDLRRNT